jgi:gluconate 2-dehydrogenase gamma chain
VCSALNAEVEKTAARQSKTGTLLQIFRHWLALMTSHSSRRQFLLGSVSGISSAWLSLRWPAVLKTQEQAQRAAQLSPATFQFFSPQDAVEIDAIAAQVIPTDNTPGAREAHVIHFIDQVLVTFERDKQPTYIVGLKNLQLKTQELFSGMDKFSRLAGAQQIQLLTTIEKSEFFEVVRLHTIMAFLSSPEHGGNYNEVGWKLIGFDDAMVHEPPFGYYDGEFRKAGK